MRIVSAFILLLLTITSLNAEKIREIANIIGVRENQVIGYGLVVGLNGTGDGSSSEFTIRSLSNLLQTVNVKIDPADIKSKNVAAVMVTAALPAFARQGDRLDVTISSIGDSKSLEGGTLLMTALKGVDGNIYALSQGSVTIGGRNGKGGGVANHTTAGTIFNGGIIEKEIVYDIYNQNFANLSLKDSNFKTAVSVQNGLNDFFQEDIAVAIDPRTIRLMKPASVSMVEFLAKTLEVNVQYQKEEKIVIDERTGTIISGINIAVDPIIITHGDITIKISPKKKIVEEELTDGLNMKDGVHIGVNENLLNMENDKITVANITRALHKLGAKPKDIISIIENIKRAGAIRAKLEVI
ncbi:flagellar basal body P-ring protein FlgI [Sulfurospirillum arcachonense]|uniref:flagellar basal body P-ring protein FlgI n=1 Tax=Sulfurospirillum arcachonense TaxID=57666 RepID=UPI0004693269|nr:flagellar basal body P-ring protein FlgI [Sulfurospirillum arcachonense]